jgi:hypothetical protein
MFVGVVVAATIVVVVVDIVVAVVVEAVVRCYWNRYDVVVCVPEAYMHWNNHSWMMVPLMTTMTMYWWKSLWRMGVGTTIDDYCWCWSMVLLHYHCNQHRPNWCWHTKDHD